MEVIRNRIAQFCFSHDSTHITIISPPPFSCSSLRRWLCCLCSQLCLCLWHCTCIVTLAGRCTKMWTANTRWGVSGAVCLCMKELQAMCVFPEYYQWYEAVSSGVKLLILFTVSPLEDTKRCTDRCVCDCHTAPSTSPSSGCLLCGPAHSSAHSW